MWGWGFGLWTRFEVGHHVRIYESSAELGFKREGPGFWHLETGQGLGLGFRFRKRGVLGFGVEGVVF